MSVRDDLKRATDKLKEKPAADTTPPIGETDAPPVSAAQIESAEPITEERTTEPPKEKQRRKSAEQRKERRVNWMTEAKTYDALSNAAIARGITVSAAIGMAVRDWLKKETSA